ncbi:MBL fold metallo-hydrolase [Streptomyces sp. NBC_00234]|uniref:MBL fold metallo-hydrolase n=1 Tax=Streptomyces sp. NBC_00234 TaxID=2903638 RepID=UPI002E2B8548|nr:MBL fold metallo-hydrolase [Streptomyces sp. NBC_00234]
MADNAPRLTVLGSATPFPSADNACSGYLLSAGDTHVWMDAGTGTLAALQRHIAFEQVDAIWISHLHADHTADLLTAFYAALYSGIRLPAPIPLYGPPGIAERLAHFLTNSARRSPVEAAFEVHELHDGHQARIGPLELTSAEVAHGMPAFAVRIEDKGADGGGVLVYSGDTAPCASLVALAAGCDVLLCEADSSTVTAGEPRVHHTPEEAGETARRAAAHRLVVTHVGPGMTPQEAVSRAGTSYGGPVEHAAPGSSFALRRVVTG